MSSPLELHSVAMQFEGGIPPVPAIPIAPLPKIPPFPVAPLPVGVAKIVPEEEQFVA